MAQAVKADVSGRDLMTRNVLASWSGHMVFVIAGFILPRMIDRNIGQTELGIWDFAWSIANYFGIAGLGIGTSVNRYVAKYRAVQNTEGLRIAISSVMVIQAICSLVVACLSIGAGLVLPVFFAEKLGEFTNAAQLVVSLLGLNIAVQMAFDSFRGVITGCHRWDIHNWLNASTYALISISMMISLVSGGHLLSLSVLYFCGTIIGEIVRAWIAFRVCPELSIRFKYFRLVQARNMLAFGLKSIAAGIPLIFVFKGTSLFIANFIGPAALALFSRPAHLVDNIGVIVNKFAMVLTPTAGSLQGSGQLDELRQLLVSSTRIGAFLTLPIVLFLSILGDPILLIWMGERYEYGQLLVVLSIGSILSVSQQPVFSILTGLNLHGKVGIVSSMVTLCTFGIGAIVLTIIGWDLIGAAVIIAIAETVGLGIVRPICACRKLKMPFLHFHKQVFLLPIFCSIPFALCLAANRFLIVDKPLTSIVVGCTMAGLTLGPLYWRYVVPGGKRQEIFTWIRKNLHF